MTLTRLIPAALLPVLLAAALGVSSRDSANIRSAPSRTGTTSPRSPLERRQAIEPAPIADLDVPSPPPPPAAAQPSPAQAPVGPIAGNPPVRLLIPVLGIDASVESVGLDRSGAMGTPQNVWNVGWYNRGPAPSAPGDAVVDGHVGLPGSPLVFAGLNRLRPGDRVVVVRSDGSRHRFIVGSAASWPADSHPPGLFALDGAPRLSLITCIGQYDAGAQAYADRLVVEATYAGPD